MLEPNWEGPNITIAHGDNGSYTLAEQGWNSLSLKVILYVSHVTFNERTISYLVSPSLGL